MYLLAAIAVSVALQFVAVYVPFFSSIMHTVPLTGLDWVYVFAVSASLLVVVEVIKLFQKD